MVAVVELRDEDLEALRFRRIRRRPYRPDDGADSLNKQVLVYVDMAHSTVKDIRLTDIDPLITLMAALRLINRLCTEMARSGVELDVKVEAEIKILLEMLRSFSSWDKEVFEDYKAALRDERGIFVLTDQIMTEIDLGKAEMLNPPQVILPQCWEAEGKAKLESPGDKIKSLVAYFFNFRYQNIEEVKQSARWCLEEIAAIKERAVQGGLLLDGDVAAEEERIRKLLEDTDRFEQEQLVVADSRPGVSQSRLDYY